MTDRITYDRYGRRVFASLKRAEAAQLSAFWHGISTGIIRTITGWALVNDVDARIAEAGEHA
jgi:hypothetical protein